MFQKNKLHAAVMACLGGLISAVPALVQAQETQRVEITGSSIKRIDAETALPVTVITRDQIDKTGLTTAADLVQSLPSMQGFLTASASVNGGGGGNTSASLHSIGPAYTLVLLNGRRHIAQHRRATGAGDSKHIGKPRHLQTQIIAWAGTPGVLQQHAIAPLNIDL
eukprot:gene53463-71468_t